MRHRQGESPLSPGGRKRLERLAEWLDEAFVLPGTRWRFGWDGILGLVPGVGDATTSLLALYIVFEALRMQVPGAVALRMVGNVALENVVGAIPLVGDLFDFAWKANRRNVALLRKFAEAPVRTRRRSTAWIAVLMGLTALVLAAAIALPILLAVGVVRLLAGA